MKSTKRMTRAAFLAGICIVLGYIFLPIPNLEMITAGIFLSGLWMGWRYGIFIAVVAESIFSIFNPMGFPPPPLLVSQVLGMAIIGFCGGMSAKYLQRATFFSFQGWFAHVYLGFLGFVLTLCFDILTNLSFPLAAGFNLEQIKVSLIMGLPFAALHILVNTVTFALVIPIIYTRFKIGRQQ